MVMADGPRHLLSWRVRVRFYDLEGTLGKGSFAVVKLGRPRITNTEVWPGARLERPRRGLGNGSVYRKGRLQQERGETREAGSLAEARGPGTVRTQEVQGMGELRGGWGPVTWTPVSSHWKLDRPGLCLSYATPSGHAEFRPELSTLKVTRALASAPEPKFGVLSAFAWE